MPVTVKVPARASRSLTSNPMASPVRIPVADINATRVWNVVALIAGRSSSAALSSAATSEPV